MYRRPSMPHLTRMETWETMNSLNNVQGQKVWLTVRSMDRTGAQAGPSDPAFPYGRDAANEMKVTLGITGL